MIKIFVFSDTHLGYTSNCSFVREQDVYDAFNHVIDKIVEIQPDIIIHAGDLFDSIRPSNKAIKCAIDGLSRIFNKTNADFILNSGNHSTPRMASATHIFNVIRSSLVQWNDRLMMPSNIAFSYAKYNFNIHIIPYCFNPSDFELAMSNNLMIDDRPYMVVAHGSLSSSSPYPQSDTIVSEQFYELIKGSKCTIMGHNHVPSINGNLLVPGSTDIFGFDEVSNKYYYTISTDSWNMVPYEIANTRPWQNIVIDCSNLDCMEIYSKIEEYGILKDAVVRLILENVGQEYINTIDRKKIKGHLNNALYNIIHIKPKEIINMVQDIDNMSESVLEVWDKWSVDMDKAVVDGGREYIIKSME